MSKWQKIFSKKELAYIEESKEDSRSLAKRIVAKLRAIVQDCESVTSGDLELSDFMDDFVNDWLDKRK